MRSAQFDGCRAETDLVAVVTMYKVTLQKYDHSNSVVN